MHWSSGHAITQNENTFLPTYAECPTSKIYLTLSIKKISKQPTYPHIISDELSPFARIVAPRESQIKTFEENVQTQMLRAQAI